MRFAVAIVLFLTTGAIAAEPRAFTTVAVLQDDEALAGSHDVDFDFRNNVCYVCGKGGSLAVIDVKDPMKPRIVWSKRHPELFDDAETVLVGRNALPSDLYLGARDFVLIGVDGNEPRVVTTIKDRPRVDRINGFVFDGDYIYAANKEGWIDVVDISLPAVPRLFTARNVAELDGVGKPHDIDLCNGEIVVVDPAGFGRRNVPGSVAFYRTRDEQRTLLPGDRWTLVGKVSDERLVGGNRVRGLAKKGRSFAIVAASISPDAIDKEKRQPCLAVVDATEVTKPVVAAVVPFPDVRGPNGLEVYGNVAFVSGGQTVMAVDLRDPLRPKLLAAERCLDVFHGEPGNDDGHDLMYGPDGYLYVTGQTSNTFGVLRVSDEIRRVMGHLR